jgi:hypothetical protein
LSWIFRKASLRNCRADPWEFAWIGDAEKQQEQKEREESHDNGLMK